MWDNLSGRLEGRLIVLEPLGRHHADALYEVGRPPEIWEGWPVNPAVDHAAFAEWIDQVLEAAGRRPGGPLRDARRRTGRPIPSTAYCTLRPEHRGLEIGWTGLTPSAWRTGVNAEAKLLLLGRAFDELGCRRVEFETDERNRRSRRA